MHRNIPLDHAIRAIAIRADGLFGMKIIITVLAIIFLAEDGSIRTGS